MRITSVELLLPAFADRLLGLEAALAACGIPLAIYETVRTPSRQMILYARGREDPNAPDYGRTVTNARPYQSAHQHGQAADLVFRVEGAWTWQEPMPGMWARMRVLAHEAGLITLLHEQPHVELPLFSGKSAEVGPPSDKEWLSWLQSKVTLVA